ncbi:phosphotransferase, partial [Rhodococcus sp. NPDC058514]|uniref:phosphotransferase n=1 Tax=Rhodococcus sp. NPDC058514 TaxID=3346532 RepID=UPI003655C077
MSLPGMDVGALRAFLVDQGLEVHGELRVELISGGRSNLTFVARDDRTKWIVRRPPVSGLTPSAHDMAREYRVTSGLQDTKVPVARTVAFDEQGSALGAQMTVVEFVEGRVVRDQSDLAGLSDGPVRAGAHPRV